VAPELEFALEIAGSVAIPLSIPLVFSSIWFLCYKLAGKRIPKGAAFTFWVWLGVTVLVVPVSVGFLALASMVNHGSNTGLYVSLGFIACVWLSIIPILLYKTIREARESRDAV
jgi:hypothetical protein